MIDANGSADRHHRRRLLGRWRLLPLDNRPQLTRNLGDQTTDICRGDRIVRNVRRGDLRRQARQRLALPVASLDPAFQLTFESVRTSSIQLDKDSQDPDK
jgi:hypothetical protein